MMVQSRKPYHRSAHPPRSSYSESEIPSHAQDVFGQAWFDGSKSVADLRFNYGKDRFPLWDITLCMATIVKDILATLSYTTRSIVGWKQIMQPRSCSESVILPVMIFLHRLTFTLLLACFLYQN